MIEVKDDEFRDVKNDLDIMRLKNEDQISPIHSVEEPIGIRFDSPMLSPNTTHKKRSKTPNLTSLRRGTYWGMYTTRNILN